jgi:excisionase family DNA binding protein
METIQPQATGRAAYSIPQICALTGLGRDSIYTAIRNGRLVARKYGKRTLITDGDLLAFLNSLPTIHPKAA